LTPQQLIIASGTDPGFVEGDGDEAIPDVQWSGAVAPKATVKLVIASSTATADGVNLSVQYIVNNNLAPVMNVSFGSCEAGMGSGGVAFYNALWQQAAAQGITALISSGDSGAAGCNSGGSSTGSMRGVNGLYSSPYDVCVGGTEFAEGQLMPPAMRPDASM
jgi:subtilase family serine protease